MPHLLNEKQDIHGNTWQAVPHPPSRDTFFIYFSEMKIALKGRRLDNTAMIKINQGTQSNTASHEVL